MNKTRIIKITSPMIGWQAIMEVTEDKGIEACKMSNEFFSDHERRLDKHDGNVALAYADLIGPRLMEASLHGGLLGVIHGSRQWEGFVALDGSQGIKLASIDRVDFSDDMEVEEEEQ